MPLTLTGGLWWTGLCDGHEGGWAKMEFRPEPCPPWCHDPVRNAHLTHEPKGERTTCKTQCGRGPPSGKQEGISVGTCTPGGLPGRGNVSFSTVKNIKLLP